MKKLILPVFILLGNLIQAQEVIVTDRPTQSAAATVVAKNYLLVEAGFVREKATSNITNFTYSNFLIRYGFSNRVEFRITQNYVGQRNDFLDQTETGLSPVTIGTKVHVLSEEKSFVAFSVIGQVTLETGDEQFNPSQPVPEVRLNFGNTLSDRFSLGYNFGVNFGDETTSTFYTAVLNYAFADGWTIFAEPYGSFFDSTSVHNFNTGLIYLLKRNLQFDVSAGWGLSDGSPDSFIGFGAALGF